jgi:hypothetical protein
MLKEGRQKFAQNALDQSTYFGNVRCNNHLSFCGREENNSLFLIREIGVKGKDLNLTSDGRRLNSVYTLADLLHAGQENEYSSF